MKILKKEDWFHPDGFPIVIERRDPQEPIGLHAHEFSEIVIITGGNGLHITGQESYELSAGDAFVIGGDRPHDYVNMEDLQLINVLYLRSKIPMNFGDLSLIPGYHAMFTLEPAFRAQHNFGSRLRLSPLELSEVSSMIDRMESELESREPGFQTITTALFLHLVAYLSRCFDRSSGSSSRSLLEIAAAISHIERYYQDPIGLDELVSISGMSKRSFLRTFEATMGLPPIKYLIRLRIRRACELLQRQELSITDVSTMVGFQDSNYFSRQFRAMTGASPSSFRKRNRLKDE